jgi:hypothetical protein
LCNLNIDKTTEGKLDYVDTIHDIIDMDYRSFGGAIFKCKWVDIYDGINVVISSQTTCGWKTL